VSCQVFTFLVLKKAARLILEEVGGRWSGEGQRGTD
jgi:hypothetical protein